MWIWQQEFMSLINIFMKNAYLEGLLKIWISYFLNIKYYNWTVNARTGANMWQNYKIYKFSLEHFPNIIFCIHFHVFFTEQMLVRKHLQIG
jgi:hypothetical protein